jgi:hypothetical protein
MSYNACSAIEILSKETFLAMLPSDLDKSQAIVTRTGEILSLTNVSQSTIDSNLNSHTWVYYENLLPRRMFLLNPNWVVNSFDSRGRTVCITMTKPTGTTVFSVSIPKI